MPAAPLDGTRLFARVHALDFECPRCATLHSIKAGKRYPGWNPRAGLFRCPSCRLALQIGVLLYPTAQGAPGHHTTASDWIPTPRQSAALRQLQTGIHLAESARRSYGPGPRNQVGASCTCILESLPARPGQDPIALEYRTVRHPNCPIHAGGTGPTTYRRGKTDNPPELAEAEDEIDPQE